MQGFTAKDAKTKSHASCSESNINKRGKALVNTGTPRSKKDVIKVKTRQLKTPYRLKPSQLEKHKNQSFELMRHSIEAFKRVTMEVQENKLESFKGKKKKSVSDIIHQANASLPFQSPKIAKSSVTQAVRLGHAGKSPKKRGPKSIVPIEITDCAKSFAQVGQVSGDEKTNTQLGNHMVAASIGTYAEGTFTELTAKRQLKKRSRLSTTASTSQVDRRFNWTTFDNLDEWFERRW
jgi:hypothetical protein